MKVEHLFTINSSATCAVGLSVFCNFQASRDLGESKSDRAVAGFRVKQ
jgi:hypothetical protein